MFTLCDKTLLALEIVIDIALHARPAPVPARYIAKRQNVSERYIEQIMQQLVQKNILRSVRGPKGGYTLARERRRIYVMDIVSIIQDKQKKQKITPNNTVQLCKNMEDNIVKNLKSISIASLCDDVMDIPNAAEKNLKDFII